MKPEATILFTLVLMGGSAFAGFIWGRIYELKKYLNGKDNTGSIADRHDRTTYTVSNIDLKREDVRN